MNEKKRPCICSNCEFRDIVFAHLDDDSIDELCSNKEEQFFRKGEIINHEGEKISNFKYLKSGLADKMDYYNYLEKYSAALSGLLSRHVTNEDYFMDKINSDMELHDYKSAESFCRIFFKHFPNSEKPYLAMLKLYYLSHDFKSFTKVSRVLKSKKIGLTEYGESVIKFWEGSKTDVS